METFWEVLNQRNLVEIEGIGCKFNWPKSNKQYVNGLKRLDRALCNSDWRFLFPEAVVRNLPRSHGNQYPVLLKLHGSFVPCRALRPFQFAMTWLTHESFADFSLHTCLSSFTIAVKD
ncbi:hypothetical protein REPUB_Repub08aG0113900 [Reevesia pubescens]